jgi:hypothetical protein
MTAIDNGVGRHRRGDDDDDGGLAKIVQINRTISFWPVVAATIGIVISVVYQATIFQQNVEQLRTSNLQLQTRVNELSQDIKSMNNASVSLATDSNLMKYQLNTVTGRVDGLENRVNTIERSRIR